MLVNGGQGIMRFEVTYGVSRIARAGRFCCEVLFVFKQQAFSSSAFPPSLPFPSLPPSLVVSVSIGLVSISTDLVSVTVPGGWWPLAELPWRPVCSAHGLWL